MTTQRGDLAVTRTLKMPGITTVERDALAADEGDRIYNDDLDQMEWFNGTAWVPEGGSSAPSGGDPYPRARLELELFTANAAWGFSVHGSYSFAGRIPSGGSDVAAAVIPMTRARYVSPGVTYTLADPTNWISNNASSQSILNSQASQLVAPLDGWYRIEVLSPDLNHGTFNAAYPPRPSVAVNGFVVDLPAHSSPEERKSSQRISVQVELSAGDIVQPCWFEQNLDVSDDFTMLFEVDFDDSQISTQGVTNGFIEMEYLERTVTEAVDPSLVTPTELSAARLFWQEGASMSGVTIGAPAGGAGTPLPANTSQIIYGSNITPDVATSEFTVTDEAIINASFHVAANDMAQDMTFFAMLNGAIVDELHSEWNGGAQTFTGSLDFGLVPPGSVLSVNCHIHTHNIGLSTSGSTSTTPTTRNIAVTVREMARYSVTTPSTAPAPSVGETTIVDAGITDWDVATAPNAYILVSIGGTLFNTPLNMVAGARYTLRIECSTPGTPYSTIGSTPGIQWGAATAGAPPQMGTGLLGIDLFAFYSDGSTLYLESHTAH